jgi:hypothetical protein
MPTTSTRICQTRWAQAAAITGTAALRLTASGVQMLVDQRWIDVPDERIQYRALLGDTGETGGGHWCGSTNKPDFGTPNTLYMTKCAVLPPQSASVQVDPP